MPPSARLTAINAAVESMRHAVQELSSVSNIEDTGPPDKSERDATTELFKTMGEVRGAMVKTKRSVIAWKPPRKRKGTGTRNSSKRTKVTHEDTREEPESLIGTPEFRKEAKDALNQGSHSIEEWYDNITIGNPGTIFNLASTGVLIVATGVAHTAQLKSTMEQVLDPTEPEKKVLESIEHASVEKMKVEHLTQIYQEVHDPYHALHKSTRINLLQHIVLGVKALQWSIAWGQIEKGSKYQSGRGNVVEDMYKAKCEAEDKPLPEDFNESREFQKYASGVKDYNTGANRFLLAYQKIQSMLLLCPLLSIFRFTNSSLGPKIKNAILQLVEDDNEGKLTAREANHRRMLFRAIKILDEDDDEPTLVAAIRDINNALGLRLARPATRAAEEE